MNLDVKIKVEIEVQITTQIKRVYRNPKFRKPKEQEDDKEVSESSEE